MSVNASRKSLSNNFLFVNGQVLIDIKYLIIKQQFLPQETNRIRLEAIYSSDKGYEKFFESYAFQSSYQILKLQSNNQVNIASGWNFLWL